MACGREKKNSLVVAIKAKVEPTPELVEPLKRYRDGLNMTIRWAVEEARAKGRLPTLSEIHKALYEPLKTMGLPSVITATCYREALAITKSYLANGTVKRTPVVKKLHMWLRRDAYRVRDGYLHVTGGYKARILGIEKRYKEGRWREAKLVYRNGNMYLFISVEAPRPTLLSQRA